MKTLLLFSGGLDSSVAAYWHSNIQDGSVGAIYAHESDGRGTEIEEQCANSVAMALDLAPMIHVDISPVVRDGAFTYFRNLKMLIAACEKAIKYDFDEVSIATNDGPDGYPDATEGAINEFRSVIHRSMTGRVPIINPLQGVSTATAIQTMDSMADDSLVKSIFREGTSCDTIKSEGNQDFDLTHAEWGVGCGYCTGCVDRIEAWNQWDQVNQTSHKCQE